MRDAGAEADLGVGEAGGATGHPRVVGPLAWPHRVVHDVPLEVGPEAAEEEADGLAHRHASIRSMPAACPRCVRPLASGRTSRTPSSAPPLASAPYTRVSARAVK